MNKSFRTYIKNKNIEYCINKKVTSSQISRYDIIDWIHDIWYDSSFIISDMIIKSFKVTGYTNNLDKSEDNLFNVFKQLKDEGIIERDKEENNKLVNI